MQRPLNSDELYSCCDSKLFPFDSTDELGDFSEIVGQERALKAIDFGVTLESKGFNIFILGESGTGKLDAIKSVLSRKTAGEPIPRDWCYVFNFKEPDVPLAISMAPGTAYSFAKDMEELIKLLKVEIPKIFESREYEKDKSGILEEFQGRQKNLFAGLEEDAKKKGFSIRKAVSGLMVVPVKASGDPLTEEEFEALDIGAKSRLNEHGRVLQERLNDVVREIREKESEVKTRISSLEREAALAAVGHYIEELKRKYHDHEKILSYLTTVTEDILEHLDDFKAQEEQAMPALHMMNAQRQEPNFSRYVVNVLVNHKETTGAPFIIENNPTYFNLFGKMEYKFQYGMATTDFTMIRAGAMHRANGGYIVINALDLLKNMLSYEMLKRSLKNEELRIEDAMEQQRLISTTTLRPEPIPLNIKVILLGDPEIYYLLFTHDEEYRNLFKVKADFDNRMPKTIESVQKYASLIATICKKGSCLPFHRSGVAKLVEYGSRLAGHQEKLSSKFSAISDLIVEANYWARQVDAETVSDEHVEKALKERIYRTNRMEELLQEMILEGTIIIDDGEKVGQINGLAVLSMGDHQFGKPSRITAVTYAGRSGLINIERETKMSGRIHEKAILIITHYLGSKYARKRPISFSASITFEQLYEMIEGDSASCAELYVILSSLSGVALKQKIAITGSMDQNGDVQPIGGVNEKIEGYFDLCKVRGLDGSHGVVIPKKNLKHLMLKREVVEAVSQGLFKIYPIDMVEEGLEIFTGMQPGIMDQDGNYPAGTINYLVAKRLEELSAASKEKKEEEEKTQKEKPSEEHP